MIFPKKGQLIESSVMCKIIIVPQYFKPLKDLHFIFGSHSHLLDANNSIAFICFSTHFEQMLFTALPNLFIQNAENTFNILY